MSLYISPNFNNLLSQHRLHTFNAIWQLKADWFEPPNHKRNGWSGVCKLQLSDKAVFLKRQHNHSRRTWLKPIQGESTLRREFQILRHLQQHQVNAPQLIAFGEALNAGKIDAVLIMEALNGYMALEDYANTQPITPPLIIAIANATRALHAAGIQHRSLYPKHIFIKKNAENFEVAFIDFEKSRFTKLPQLRAVSDMRTFLNRVADWPVESRLIFFKAYYGLDMGEKSLNFAYHALWFMMQKH